MHEVALCQSLVDIIRDQQREKGFNRVSRVFVEVGALGHVDPHALAFAFDVEVPGTVHEYLDEIGAPGDRFYEVVAVDACGGEGS